MKPPIVLASNSSQYGFNALPHSFVVGVATLDISLFRKVVGQIFQEGRLKRLENWFLPVTKVLEKSICLETDGVIDSSILSSTTNKYNLVISDLLCNSAWMEWGDDHQSPFHEIVHLPIRGREDSIAIMLDTLRFFGVPIPYKTVDEFEKTYSIDLIPEATEDFEINCELRTILPFAHEYMNVICSACSHHTSLRKTNGVLPAHSIIEFVSENTKHYPWRADRRMWQFISLYHYYRQIQSALIVIWKYLPAACFVDDKSASILEFEVTHNIHSPTCGGLIFLNRTLLLKIFKIRDDHIDTGENPSCGIAIYTHCDLVAMEVINALNNLVSTCLSLAESETNVDNAQLRRLMLLRNRSEGAPKSRHCFRCEERLSSSEHHPQSSIPTLVQFSSLFTDEVLVAAILETALPGVRLCKLTKSLLQGYRWNRQMRLKTLQELDTPGGFIRSQHILYPERELQENLMSIDSEIRKHFRQSLNTMENTKQVYSSNALHSVPDIIKTWLDERPDLVRLFQSYLTASDLTITCPNLTWLTTQNCIKRLNNNLFPEFAAAFSRVLENIAFKEICEISTPAEFEVLCDSRWDMVHPLIYCIFDNVDPV